VQPSDAYSQFWLPASDHAHKQARTVHAPYGREPSELLALVREYFAGIRIERDKSRKLKLSKKTFERGMRRTTSLLVIDFCLSRSLLGVPR